MYGLAVRWSLQAAPVDAAERLRDYVTGTSLATFTGMDGLRFKTWRQRPGEWFEGTYVFATAQARDGFEASFRQKAPTAPVTELIGGPLVSIERFEVVAVAEGGAGFAAGPGPGDGAA
jgi:hypothetical protein